MVEHYIACLTSFKGKLLYVVGEKDKQNELEKFQEANPNAETVVIRDASKYSCVLHPEQREEFNSAVLMFMSTIFDE